MVHHLAELNVARLRRPLDHDDTAEFVAALEPINALAEASPGYVWRLTDDEGQSSSYVSLPENEDPLVIVNYSIWADLESLKSFMYKTSHSGFLRRRSEWFERLDEAATVCWWVPAGTIPDLAEAYARLQDLRSVGPAERGWPLSNPFPAPA